MIGQDREAMRGKALGAQFQFVTLNNQEMAKLNGGADPYGVHLAISPDGSLPFGVMIQRLIVRNGSWQPPAAGSSMMGF